MEILQMNKKELEDYLNSFIKNLNYEDVNQVSVKEKMIDTLQKKLKGIKITSNYTDFREIFFGIKNIGFTFKVSVKRTDKIKQITKLKSKYIQKPSKFKFEDCCIGIIYPQFKWKDEKKFLVQKTLNTICGGYINFISLKELNMKFEDIYNNKKLLCKLYQEQNDENKTLKEVLNQLASQELIQKYYFHQKGKISKTEEIFPEPYKTKLINEPDKDYEILTNMIYDYNNHIYDEIENYCLQI